MHGHLRGWAGGFALGAILASGTVWAAESTIPTGAPDAATARCTVGQTCTFAAPVFACDHAGAERIVTVGPVKGSEVGADFVREQTCQTVPPGRPVTTEATRARGIVYLSEGGKHLGYMPVGIFAPGGAGSAAGCDQPGFCVVRAGPPIWICPSAENLSLPTPEAKSAAKCLRMSRGNVGEVTGVANGSVTLANMFGGRPPYQSSYHAARADFVGISLQPYPSPAARGWCKPDTWCVTAAATLFCSDRAAHELVHAMPPGEPYRTALQAEPGCRVVIGGNVLKPKAMPNVPSMLVAVEHPILSLGWASADAFPTITYFPPLRDTGQLSDLKISEDRSVPLVAIELRGQGTSAAVSQFRSGPRERRAFCNAQWDEHQQEAKNSCLSDPDETLKGTADCSTRRLALNDRRYGLLERPGDASPDIHADAHRVMVYRDLASGEWLDGSTRSGEALVRTSFNALCPAVDPAISFGLVYRDPQAAFPRELRGRWFDSRRACADPQRNAPDYEGNETLIISPQERTGNRTFEYAQRVNAVRRVGPRAWEVDGTHRINDPELLDFFGMETYTLTRDGLTLGSGRTASRWVRCR
ncbi:hypothetical protein [Methylobacterium sp. J-090]|uniref:hypothetical protein n=1 Tax=Methylobacterium sp. J-090 TaxID=2836666 RepID=UPI001FB8F017|nr:hypothetical protein [Methylobacterium sp. J-090]MCJ2084160.1 hypothetical protein [Methylobacterium sp. J-090]